MKKTFFTLAVAVGVVAAAFWGCDKQNVAIPGISNVSVSDCHFPDPDRLSKSSDEDSIAVSWVIGIPNSMIITHYNMDLDCGSDNRIVTTVEMAGDVVTVTEHVGEQGMTDCFCFYDNTFQIVHGTDSDPVKEFQNAYFWIQNTFKADAMIHFGTHGGLEFTPRKQVALSSNDWPDKLVGTKPVNRSTEFKAVFSVPYEPGTLRAKAGGNQVTLATAGAPARLRLTADKQTLKADGQTLAFITVEVIDKDGRVCPEAAIPCEVSVSGQAALMAAASADLKDREPATSQRVTTWKGRALIVVRSSQKKGKAQIRVKSELPAAVLNINSK